MQFFYQKGTKGFTLTEIITAVVIVAILASLSIPYFTKTIEISRGRIAKANLESIYSAQRIYRDKNENGCYYPYPPGTVNDLAEINRELGLNIKSSDFNYSITTESCNAFTAEAVRNSGRYNNWVIRMSVSHVSSDTTTVPEVEIAEENSP